MSDNDLEAVEAELSGVQSATGRTCAMEHAVWLILKARQERDTWKERVAVEAGCWKDAVQEARRERACHRVTLLEAEIEELRAKLRAVLKG